MHADEINTGNSFFTSIVSSFLDVFDSDEGIRYSSESPSLPSESFGGDYVMEESSGDFSSGSPIFVSDYSSSLVGATYNYTEVFGDDYDTHDGTCIRDYIHVIDLANAHIKALNYLREGNESNIFNLGSGNGFTVKEMIEAAKEATGEEIKVVIGERRLGDPAKLVASSQKAKEILGWTPEFDDVKKMIGDAWNWHKNHPNGFNN